MSNSHLEQVKLDAERITLKRIEEAKAEREYQESKVGEHLHLDDERPVEVADEKPAVQAAPAAQAVKTTKGK